MTDEASHAVEFQFQLFLANQEPHSQETAQLLGDLLEQRLGGRFILDVVDVSREPEQARQARILATPALVKTAPAPLQQFVGDLRLGDELLDELGCPV